MSEVFGHGDGTLQPAKQFPESPDPGLAPQGLVVADVVSRSGKNTLSILLGSCGP